MARRASGERASRSRSSLSEGACRANVLMEAGADVNHFTASLRPFEAASVQTPLGWAAYRNGVPMVRNLLERNADPNLVTPRLQQRVKEFTDTIHKRRTQWAAGLLLTRGAD